MKPLKFIHITKTGGTSIEDCAIEKNIRFGRFHLKYRSLLYPRANTQYHCFFPDIPESLRTQNDWFMVVRNPYDRILSEYHCEWGGTDKYGFKNNAQNQCIYKMNQYIQTCILNRNPKGDHYSEQYKYLDSSENVKIHIIKFENLKKDFNALMKQYNIDLTLNIHHNKNVKRFSVSDFSKTTIRLINSIYEPDFRLFGYEMITT